MGQQAGLDKQAKVMLQSVRALAAGYVGLTIVISLVVGLLIGWFLFGWVIAPVQWTDAKPVRLSPQYQEVFLRYAADSYAAGNTSLEDAVRYMGEGWTKQQVLDILDKMIANNDPAVSQLSALRSALAAYPGEELGPAAPPPVEGTPVGTVLLLLLLVIVVVVLGFVIIRRMRSAPAAWQTPGPEAGTVTGLETPVQAKPAPPVSRAQGAPKPVQKTTWAGESQPPLAQYMTTYSLGDDRYDVSFSIETEGGDFLGECGVGISETIGMGNPDKVTALEVWLFDKNDIRTLTKVLMSEHCYNDAALRSKLAAKGEAVLVKKGEIVELSTQTLKVNARVVDLQYGSGSLPNNSFFQQVTIELAAWSTSA